jgi:K+-sensing histidine kinase KdpD
MKDGRELAPEELPLQRAATTGSEVHEMEVDLEYDDGQRATLIEYAAPLFDADGSVRGAVGAFVDITERKRTEEAQRFLARASDLLASSLDYRETLQRVAHLVVPDIADWCNIDLIDDGRVRTVAMAHRDADVVRQVRAVAKRYPASTESGTGVAEVMRTGRSVLFEEVTDAHLAMAARDAEHLALLKNSGFKSFLCSPMIARGRTVGAITFVATTPGRRFGQRDLALAEDLARRAAIAVDNARLYQEAQDTADELRVANQAKDEFLGLVSHELRTPITTIFGNAQVLRKRDDRIAPADRILALSDIEQEAGRLSRIIDNMLILARVDAADAVVAMEPVVLAHIIRRLVEEHGKSSPDRPIVLRLAPDVPLVAAEPVYVEQTITNLLSNAEKYSPPGALIEVEARGEENDVHVIVRDRGMGLREDEAERIFEPFYRGEHAAKLSAGAGMGLAVCRRLVEVQSGQIWARPREGGGSEFEFTLPLAKEQAS